MRNVSETFLSRAARMCIETQKFGVILIFPENSIRATFTSLELLNFLDHRATSQLGNI